MNLKIITPKSVAYEAEITAITLPASEGEVTVLPHHVPFFTMLKEGVVRIQMEEGETLFSVGGGYAETDGADVNVLVSRAFGQDEIDEAEVLEAQKQAEELLKNAPTDADRKSALQLLRRSTIDMKLLKRVKTRRKTN